MRIYPKVSVIICFYNAENTIERCVHSLFQQTLDDIEYIFVNDCSTDDSVCRLNALLDIYPNRKNQTKLFSLDKNKGQAVARRKGIAEATGQYVIHCDSDDWVHIDMYKQLYDKAITDSSDLVWCDYSYVNDENQNIIHKQFSTTNKIDFIKSELLGKVHGALWNKLVRREIVQNETVQVPLTSLGEDLLLTIQYVHLSKKISYYDKSLYYYYQNPNSTTSATQNVALLKNRSKDSEINFRLLERILEEKKIARQLSSEIQYAKFVRKQALLSLVKVERKYDEWQAKYPEISYSILVSPYLTWQQRVIAFLLFTRTYLLFY